MRWPWTRETKDKDQDNLRAQVTINTLDAAVAKLNNVLDRAGKTLDRADERLKGDQRGS